MKNERTNANMAEEGAGKNIKIDPKHILLTNNVYSNIVMYGLKNRRDLYGAYKLADDAMTELEKAYSKKQELQVPVVTEAIVYLSIIAEAIDCNVIDLVVDNSDMRKRFAYGLVDFIKKNQSLFYSADINREEGYAQFVYRDFDEDYGIKSSDNNRNSFASSAYGDHNLELMKEIDADGIANYYMSYGNLSIFSKSSYQNKRNKDNDAFKTFYSLHGGYLWEEERGNIAEFIEDLICEREKQKDGDDKENDADDSKSPEIGDENASSDDEKNKAGKSINESKESIIDVQKPIIESEDPSSTDKVLDELVKRVDSTTRTVDLLDEFEGSKGKPYRRLIISNPTCSASNSNVWLNLVIERGHGDDYVGDITFTQLKKEDDSDLRQYIKSQITPDIADKYVDKDHFYRFKKPYLLRAQNSSNRSGYGWEWDWSGGYGDYTEGTFYGETTNYFIVGAYITSFDSFWYDPRKRAPMDNLKSQDRELSLKEIIFYEGKLSEVIRKKATTKYLQINDGGKLKFIPGSWDQSSGVLYVNSGVGKKYEETIMNRRYRIVDKNEALS